MQTVLYIFICYCLHIASVLVTFKFLLHPGSQIIFFQPKLSLLEIFGLNDYMSYILRPVSC